MSTRIKINVLSEKSIRDAVADIERYKTEFIEKNREFLRKLVEAGIEVVHNNLSAYQYSTDGTGDGDSIPPTAKRPYVRMGVNDGIMIATLTLQGKDVMFVEFGAGVHFNGGVAVGSPNPKGVELGYTIGSYGMGQGKYDHWYYERNGEEHISYGTRAMMPMYQADMKIRTKFVDIAKKVFGG